MTATMSLNAIRDALIDRIGNLDNEPAGTAIGRFVRGQWVDLAALAADLDRTEGAEELSAAVRQHAA